MPKKSKKKTIVVVDDSEVALAVAHEALSEAGYNVLIEETPFELGDVIKKHEPDLVLVDIGMPLLSGDKLIEVIARHGLEKKKIVLYSARPKPELAKIAKSLGVAGFIEKGDPEGLVEGVSKYV